MHYPTFAGISSKKNPEYARDLSLQKAMRPDLLFGVKGVEGIGVELFDRDAKVSRQLGVKGGFEEQLEVPHVGVLSVQVDLDPKVPRHPLHPVDHWDDLGDRTRSGH